jgi:fibro-slime domain-containing protein
MNFAVPFVVLASGDESFEITADDDTFVYVDTKLAIDLGGVHDAMSGKLVISEAGEVYTAVNDEELAYSGINVEKNQNAILRIFHADRDSENSVLKTKIAGMNLNIVDATFAGADEGVQIAYDPTDPSYMPPLGQSMIVRPDSTRGYIILATIEGVAIVVIAIFSVVMARALIKNKK